MNRRAAKTVVVFLLAGAAVNVAVAWGLAVVVDLRLTANVRRAGANWSGDGTSSIAIELGEVSMRKVGLQRVYYFIEPPRPSGGPPRAPLQDLIKRELVREQAMATLRGIGANIVNGRVGWLTQMAATSVDSDLVICLADARGWPYLSLTAGAAVDPQADGSLALADVCGFAMSPRGGTPPLLAFRILPIVPLWPGFAINTFFYAAILWLLISGPSGLRRRLRVRRGLCAACAYPVGSSPVCTECGRAVVAMKTAS